MDKTQKRRVIAAGLAIMAAAAVAACASPASSTGTGAQVSPAVAKLVDEHGNAKLTHLLLALAARQKARSASIHHRCRAVYRQPLP